MGNRDDGEFSEFVLEQRESLLRTACLLTTDRGLGEDLVQSTLLKAYGHWRRVRGAEDPVAYVHRILINTHLSWRRRTASTERVVEAVPDRPGGDLQAAHAEGADMRRALRQLSPRVRTAIVLRFFDDHSEAQTARLMGCSVSTVNNHVRTGLATLRGLLAGGDDSDLVSPSRSAR